MPKQKPAIVGSVLKGGRIYKAGDEELLASALSQADKDRLVGSGQLTGDWSGNAATEEPANAAEPDEDAGEAEGEDTEEAEGLPTLADMPAHLASITDADELKALRRSDKRKGAKPMYKARLAELEG